MEKNGTTNAISKYDTVEAYRQQMQKNRKIMRLLLRRHVFQNRNNGDSVKIFENIKNNMQNQPAVALNKHMLVKKKPALAPSIIAKISMHGRMFNATTAKALINGSKETAIRLKNVG